MSDKTTMVIAVSAFVFLAILAHEEASVGKARAAIDVERVKACAAAGKQMQPIVLSLGNGQTVQEMECR